MVKLLGIMFFLLLVGAISPTYKATRSTAP